MKAITNTLYDGWFVEVTHSMHMQRIVRSSRKATFWACNTANLCVVKMFIEGYTGFGGHLSIG
jgi:hypothetical protein